MDEEIELIPVESGDLLELGAVIKTRRMTVTEAHVVNFASITGDHHPLHCDAEYARQSAFGERLVHGPLLYSLSAGLASATGVFDHNLVALLGVDNVRHRHPCFIGDTISVRAVVSESTPWRGAPGRRAVTLHYSATKQNDDEVFSGDFTFLMQDTDLVAAPERDGAR